MKESPHRSTHAGPALMTIAFATVLATILYRAPVSAQQAAPLSPQVIAQIAALTAEKAARTPEQRKISSQLLYASRMARGEAIAAGVETLDVHLPDANALGAVLDIRVDVSQQVLNQFVALGAELLDVNQQYSNVRLRIDVRQVEALAMIPEVTFIQPKQEALTSRVDTLANVRPVFNRRTPRATRVLTRLDRAQKIAAIRAAVKGEDVITSVGSQSSQGDSKHNVNSARTAFGVDGTGIKIGVLSDGVTNLAASQALGDLPPDVVVLPGQTGTGDEGTAMLEIIHDLAPGADLYFATAFTSLASFAQNIRDLQAAGCDIIVDDVLYFVETPFQDGQGTPSTTNGGIVIQAVKDVTAAGTLFFSSAANSGNKNDGTSGTWEGDFVDGGVATGLLTGTGRVHDFDPGPGVQLFNVLTASTSNPISLFWADPLGGSSNDYDIYRLNSTGTVLLAASTGFQTGTQDPFEIMGGGLAGERIVIVKFSGNARFLHLSTNRNRLSISTDGETHGHAATSAANSFGVAATSAQVNGLNPFDGTHVVETFSSDGPRRIFFQGNGTAITPGNFTATGGQLLQKPDFTAADGVSVTGVGGFPSPFFGTSAAAPHAAAIAGLVKSRFPSFSAAQIRAALLASTIDIEASGFDRDSGYGIIMADKALDSDISISGRVTGVGGVGLSDVTVEIYSAAGTSVTSVTTNASGHYNVSGLSAGTYFAHTYNLKGYLDELYNNLPCFDYSCNKTAGTPIVITAGATTSGIDFALAVGGSISGRVTSPGGVGLSDVEIEIYNASRFVANGVVSATGHYTTHVGLPTGTYFALAYNAGGFVDELYNNLSCPGTFCEVTAGTPIQVTAGATTGGIDFAMSVGGSISGTVTGTGNVGLSNVPVEIYNAAGSQVGTGITNAAGQYSLSSGLPTGIYFARTKNIAGYVDELFDNLPCHGGICDVTTGTPISVTAGTIITGVNFALTSSPSITGTVTGAGGIGLNGVTVQVYSAAGALVTSSTTSASGQYSVSGLATGNYFARTSNAIGYVDELFDNLPCVPSCTVTTGTPIGVTTGVTTPNIIFALVLSPSTTPGISGRVTGVGGVGLVNVSVTIYDTSGDYVTSSMTDAAGQYIVSGLPPGTYFAQVYNVSGYVAELYDNVPCPSGGCDVTTGTPIVVTAGVTTPGIDFALTLGGRISGTVTGAGVVGLSSVVIDIYDVSGSLVLPAFTNASGQYETLNLPPGTYYAWASNYSGFSYYVDELYNNLPCPSGSCDEKNGTPIAVTAGVTTAGIDFSLALGGRITGSVFANGSGGLTGVSVDIYDASGSWVTSTSTNSSGIYLLERALPVGNYFARTSDAAAYADELYDNLPCGGSCNVTAGTPIAVAAGLTTQNIHFELTPSPSISGTVTGAGGGGLSNVTVLIYNASGNLVTSGMSAAGGHYSVSGLSTATYFARTSNASGYVDELYDNLPCVASCTITTGTPIAVTANATTGGINFALALGGSINGTVTGAGGLGLSNITVQIYNAAGTSISSASTNANGQYTVENLPAGTYFARTINALGYFDELYDNGPCAPSCTVTTGTPITVTAGATTNISFALALGGTITGTVTGAGGLGLSTVIVQVYNASGSFVTSASTTGTGQYTTSVVPAGTYFAKTVNSLGYLDELYNNLPCASSCTVTTGTSITVTANATTTSINFVLTLSGSISGTVTGATGGGLSSVTVQLYNAAGTSIASASTDNGGQYTVTNLSTGTYVARTINSLGYVDELYNNIPCPGGACNVTTGTPITVTGGSTTSAINFALATNSPLGTVAVTPTTLNFAGTNTGGTLSPLTPAQTVTVAFTGVSNTTWSATANQPWVQLTGASGNGSGSFTVGIINPGGILPTNVVGSQANLSATITLTASNVSNSPRTITVNLSLQPGSTFTAPIGLVDTPLQNASGLVGAIGVTGWVVDDVGITQVQVYRNCLSFESPGNCQTINGHSVVFIGNATLVPGARPDIEALFPAYPSANVGAWGYLLLTSMLPHIPNNQMFGGQGPLTLYIFATDVEGHRKQLGRTQFDTTPTQITMGNDTIAKPFGAIDTPGQGATVNGTFANFGWALTPDGNTVADVSDITVPTNGSTMSVLIDGSPVGTVSFNQCRGVAVSGPVPGGVFCDDDVSSIFGNPTPQVPFTTRTSNPTRHRNLDAGRGPIGAYILDTTTLTNGIHTIMWVVFDDDGRGEGIGSRFFTVLNGSSLIASDLSTAATATLGTAEDLASYPVDAEAVWGRQGFSAPREELLPDAAGRRAARMSAQGRLEIALGEGVRRGYLVANGTLRALPPGSRLDPATGLFTWHPVLGYLGTYDLTFLRENGTQVPLTVTLEPDGSAPGHLEIAVDRPAVNATVSGAFTVEGWALDTGAWQGAGIGAVHVWAQRMDVPMAAPEFLGAASLNGARSDVAAVYGTQFERAGWAVSVARLAPGTYDVTAYVWRARTQQFEDARTVRVTVR